jgi:hypothetical protein
MLQSSDNVMPTMTQPIFRFVRGTSSKSKARKIGGIAAASRRPDDRQ